MKIKMYCDRCKQIDEEHSMMVSLNTERFHYKNLKKSLGDGENEKLDRLVGKSQDSVILCDNCYLDFMDFKGSIFNTNNLTTNTSSL